MIRRHSDGDGDRRRFGPKLTNMSKPSLKGQYRIREMTDGGILDNTPVLLFGRLFFMMARQP